MIDVPTASEMLGIAEQTIYNKRNSFSIPFVKVGGRLLFYAEELEEWIRNGGDHYAAIDIMLRKGRIKADFHYVTPDNAAQVQKSKRRATCRQSKFRRKN